MQQSTAGDGTLVLLPALAVLNHFDAGKVRVQTAPFTTTVQNIISGNVNGALTYGTLFPALQVAASRAGKTASSFLYADYGLDVYNNGIVAQESFIGSHPDVVRAFNQGFAEAVSLSVHTPSQAIDILTRHVPGLDPEVALAELQVAINHLNVAEVRRHGFGPMDESKMSKTLDIVNQYYRLAKPVASAGEVYTNDLVPTGVVPQFDSPPIGD